MWPLGTCVLCKHPRESDANPGLRTTPLRVPKNTTESSDLAHTNLFILSLTGPYFVLDPPATLGSLETFPHSCPVLHAILCWFFLLSFCMHPRRQYSESETLGPKCVDPQPSSTAYWPCDLGQPTPFLTFHFLF